MIEAIDLQYEKSVRPLTDHIAAFVSFREKLSLRVLELTKEVESIKDMFKEIENNKVHGLNDFPVFKDGAKYYCDLLDLNLPKVI